MELPKGPRSGKAEPFQLLAGHVALDLANTVDERSAAGGPRELLPNYRRFLDFCEQTGIVTTDEARHLEHDTNLRDAARALQEVVQFREALYAILAADLHRSAPPSASLASLNRVLAEADASRHLVWDKRRFVWRDGDPAAGPTAPLWPIARAAAALLTSEERAWVRECGQSTCRWLFLDRSRNHSRRWCDMKSCGNRQKARRFQARHQKRRQRN